MERLLSSSSPTTPSLKFYAHKPKFSPFLPRLARFNSRKLGPFPSKRVKSLSCNSESSSSLPTPSYSPPSNKFSALSSSELWSHGIGSVPEPETPKRISIRVSEKNKTLRARVFAKTEEKKLELLFLRWSDHNRKLCNFIRTKAEPAIEKRKDQAFEEWKAAKRAELSEYQKQIGEQYITNLEKDLERWKNARNRKGNDSLKLQETMDKELDMHRLEHGPKKRKISSGSNDEGEEDEDEDDVEDINAGEDDMEDVLGLEDNGRRAD